MKTLTANDALGIARDRATTATGHCLSSRAVTLYQAASELWADEYDAYVALSHLPALTHAANCAWERRCAASKLTQILVAAI